MARIKNMVLITQRSWKNKRNGLGVFRLVCEYYGYARGKPDVDKDFPPSSNREKKSKKRGCAFELEGREYKTDKWIEFWLYVVLTTIIFRITCTDIFLPEG